jgi:hypothetical protein
MCWHMHVSLMSYNSTTVRYGTTSCTLELTMPTDIYFGIVSTLLFVVIHDKHIGSAYIINDMRWGQHLRAIAVESQ